MTMIMTARGGTGIGLRCLVLALAIAVVGAIYPEGHFDRVKQLTVDNFDDWINEQVDSGKTAMAPAWNLITRAFEGHNASVVFGDVNLSEESIRGDHNPGAGGWPTIKYFNRKTGVEGGTYEKKTSDAMCVELGNYDNLIDYVERVSNTTLCSSDDGSDDDDYWTNCNDRELAYLKTVKDESPKMLQGKLARLEGMEGQPMKDDLMLWVLRRKRILKHLLNDAAAAAGNGNDSKKEEL